MNKMILVSSVLLVYTAKKSAMLFLVIELGDVFFRKLPGPPTPSKKKCMHTFIFFFHFPPPPKSWCLKKVEIWVDPHWDVGRNKWIKCLVLNYNYNWVFPSLKIGVGKEVFSFCIKIRYSQKMNVLFTNL